MTVMIIEELFFKEQAARLKKMAEEEKRQKAAFRKKVRSSIYLLVYFITQSICTGFHSIPSKCWPVHTPYVCLDGERGVRFYSR